MKITARGFTYFHMEYCQIASRHVSTCINVLTYIWPIVTHDISIHFVGPPRRPPVKSRRPLTFGSFGFATLQCSRNTWKKKSSYRNREVNDRLWRPQSLGFKTEFQFWLNWLIKACFRVGRRKIITDFCCIFDGSLPEIDTDQVEARGARWCEFPECLTYPHIESTWV